MKNIVLLAFLLFFSSVYSQKIEVKGNPIITNKFTADPATLAYNGKLYLYAGHDDAKEGEDFNIKGWLCYSTEDMKTWTDHGIVLKPTDFKWGVSDAWASQVVEKDGKFYFYTTVQAGAPYNCKVIGVAVSDSPIGPFEDAIGSPLVTDDMTPNGPRGWWNDIDPTVYIDDSGTPWMSWGNGTCFVAKLKKNMIELDGPIYTLDLPQFVEGPWIHKHGDLYYLSYASHVAKTGSEMIAYATASKMEGPWEYRGILTGHAKNSFTIHPAIVEFKGNSYLFYHNAALTLNGLKGSTGRRAVCVDYLYYNNDGSILYVDQTEEGIAVPPKSRNQIQGIQSPFELDAEAKNIRLVEINK